MTLEEAILETAREGRLSFSVYAISEGYQANISMGDRKAWRVEMAADPVTALKKALGLLPGASGQMRAGLSDLPKDNTSQGSIFD